jgi:hypothetical protein
MRGGIPSGPLGGPRRLVEAAQELADRAGAWLADRALAPVSVTGVALVLGICAGVWFSAGTRTGDVRGAVALFGAYLAAVAARQLAAAADVTEPVAEQWADAADPGTPWTVATGRPGWLAALTDRVVECVVYIGLALGAAAQGWTGTWQLAIAVLAVSTAQQTIRACSRPNDGDLTTAGPLRHGLESILAMPPGGRMLAVAIVAPTWGARVCLLVLLDWAIIAVGYAIGSRSAVRRRSRRAAAVRRLAPQAEPSGLSVLLTPTRPSDQPGLADAPTGRRSIPVLRMELTAPPPGMDLPSDPGLWGGESILPGGWDEPAAQAADWHEPDEAEAPEAWIVEDFTAGPDPDWSDPSAVPADAARSGWAEDDWNMPSNPYGRPDPDVPAGPGPGDRPDPYGSEPGRRSGRPGAGAQTGRPRDWASSGRTAASGSRGEPSAAAGPDGVPRRDDRDGSWTSAAGEVPDWASDGWTGPGSPYGRPDADAAAGPGRRADSEETDRTAAGRSRAETSATGGRGAANDADWTAAAGSALAEPTAAANGDRSGAPVHNMTPADGGPRRPNREPTVSAPPRASTDNRSGPAGTGAPGTAAHANAGANADGAGGPTGTDASGTDPGLNDAAATDPTATDPTASDPAAADSTATDPDSTATDPDADATDPDADAYDPDERRLIAAIRRCRDDGAIALWFGSLVRGQLLPLPAALLALVAVSLLARLGLRDLPGLLILAPAIVMLVAAPGSGNPHTGRFDWLVPGVLLGAQYVYLASLGFAYRVPVVVTFALCAALAVRYADLAFSGSPALPDRQRPARLRAALYRRIPAAGVADGAGAVGHGAHENPPEYSAPHRSASEYSASDHGASEHWASQHSASEHWAATAEPGSWLGWEGRMIFCGLGAAMGVATAAYIALAVFLIGLVAWKVTTGYTSLRARGLT